MTQKTRMQQINSEYRNHDNNELNESLNEVEATQRHLKRGYRIKILCLRYPFWSYPVG